MNEQEQYNLNEQIDHIAQELQKRLRRHPTSDEIAQELQKDNV